MDWKSWNTGKRTMIVAAAVIVFSMLLPWADIVIISENGFEQGAVLLLAVYAYPVYAILANKPLKRGTAIGLAALGLVLGAAYYASNIKTMEADGFIFDEDVTLDVNGSGVYVYLLAAVAFVLGAVKDRPAPTADVAMPAMPPAP